MHMIFSMYKATHNIRIPTQITKYLSCGLFLMMPGLLLGERFAKGEPDAAERGRELGWGPPGEFTEEEDEETTVAVR